MLLSYIHQLVASYKIEARMISADVSWCQQCVCAVTNLYVCDGDDIFIYLF